MDITIDYIYCKLKKIVIGTLLLLISLFFVCYMYNTQHKQLWFLSRCLIHRTYLEVWSTFWQVTEITWLNTWPSIKTSNQCGTLGQRRGQSSWSSLPQKMWREPGSIMGSRETGLTQSRVRGRSFCTSPCRSKTSGFQWGISSLIKK